jgi:ATP-dependent DNA helicase RecG
VPELVPASTARDHKLVPGAKAVRWIHRPDNWHELEQAQHRLRFEEAFVVQAVLARRRQRLAGLDARPRTGRAGGLLDRFDERLPFTLTAGQQAVGQRLLDDLAADHPMHVLLQGEVGSGKTVVALRAMLRVVDSGGQAALLAPTEVLAQQHHRSITRMLGDLAGGGMLGGAEGATRVALLTGSLGAAARREAMLDAASGAAGIVIGTHALLEDKVSFADLGLVVVDEQHRFGVEQRAALAAKAGELPPHVLVMTATPIPRTVAMTIFGDLETVELRELPAGRAEIQSNVVPLAEQPGWLDRVWARLREEAGKGHQAYVVCPRIGDDLGNGDPDEEPPADLDKDESPLAAVEEVAPALAAGPLAGLRVATLHGRMAPDVKDETMRAFAAGEVDVLVSTTVIEVGVDVPNATAMVVLDADRFGISQLHQLRGRVGRGGLHGLCLLVTRASGGSLARERLDAVASTTDGFALSDVDLDLRQEGDVLGSAQSGRRSSLRLLKVREHEAVIVDARDAAERLLAEDPELAGCPPLADALHRLETSDRVDYLEKT